MTKRKNQLADKLGEIETPQPPQGWRDQVGRKEPERQQSGPVAYLRKTYLMTPALEKRIKDLAEEERVGQNELVRFLLTYALDKVAKGDLILPAKPVDKRTLSG